MFLKEVGQFSLTVCPVVLTACYPDRALRPFNEAESHGS